MMKYRPRRRFYNARYNPMQSDNLLFSANKFGGRHEIIIGLSTLLKSSRWRLHRSLHLPSRPALTHNFNNCEQK